MIITSPRRRKFLVVIDHTPECHVAVRFAARRAQHTGGQVSLLCVMPRSTYHEWRGVEALMMEEARAEAEKLVSKAARQINELTRIVPEIIIEFGSTAEVLLDLIRSDKEISILVLASASAREGPGPLVSLFSRKIQPIPATIVPGDLTDDQVDAIT